MDLNQVEKHENALNSYFKPMMQRFTRITMINLYLAEAPFTAMESCCEHHAFLFWFLMIIFV